MSPPQNLSNARPALPPTNKNDVAAAASYMPIGSRFRLIDSAGSELGGVMASMTKGETVYLPDGRPATVVEVCDDEQGQEGGVRATLVVER